MGVDEGEDTRAARESAILHSNISPTEAESVSTAVVEAMSDVAETPPVELPPLYNSIEPAALDNLFAPREDGPDRSISTTFTYHGYRVSVEDGVTIAIYPLT